MCQKKAEQAQLTTNLNHPVTQWLHEFSVACHPEAQRLSCSMLIIIGRHDLKSTWNEFGDTNPETNEISHMLIQKHTCNEQNHINCNCLFQTFLTLDVAELPAVAWQISQRLLGCLYIPHPPGGARILANEPGMTFEKHKGGIKNDKKKK